MNKTCKPLRVTLKSILRWPRESSYRKMNSSITKNCSTNLARTIIHPSSRSKEWYLHITRPNPRVTRTGLRSSNQICSRISLESNLTPPNHLFTSRTRPTNPTKIIMRMGTYSKRPGWALSDHQLASCTPPIIRSQVWAKNNLQRNRARDLQSQPFLSTDRVRTFSIPKAPTVNLSNSTVMAREGINIWGTKITKRLEIGFQQLLLLIK